MKKFVAALIVLGAILPAYASGEMAGYLFVFFTGGKERAGESIFFATSRDGYDFRVLNGGNPVLVSADISQTGGVRDPHIMRRHDGAGFYMVATDMVAANGWDSNRGMVLMTSPDLLRWSHSTVNIQQKYPCQEELKRVWAPQTIYDPEAGKYMIYWSMKHGDCPDTIYYAYANDSFTDLEGEPAPLFVPADGMACIDADIVVKDGVYHLFYKTEGHGNGIKTATARSLTSGEWTEDPEYKQLTSDPVEGAAIFGRIGEDTYVLTYDVYRSRRYDFCESTDLVTFRPSARPVTMDFHPRHGSIMQVSEDELRRLAENYPGKPEAK